MVSRVRIVTAIVLVMSMSACGNIGYKPRGFEVQPVIEPQSTADQSVPDAHVKSTPRKIVIFFDGTQNDEGSDTNVKRLHSLLTLQARPDIASLYVLGVGTELDPIGAVTGAGINARVELAYEFILNHFQPAKDGVPADEIYIFGFSRGAYAGRILATMLNYAGIVEEIKEKPGDLRRLTPKELSAAVHAATFPCFECGAVDKPRDRPARIEAALKSANLRSVPNGPHGVAVPVAVLGLWDTVQALGMPAIGRSLLVPFLSAPPEVDVDEPNHRYGERLCNVQRAFHAMSIDDNRETIFTPLLLSRAHHFDGCKSGFGMLDDKGSIQPGHLQEVWFSGAHSDVGGGYANGALSGVSLNWMLNRLRCMDLLPGDDCKSKGELWAPKRYVREDVYGGSHDPTAGIWFFYPKVNRDLVRYAFSSTSIWGSAIPQICVHESVFTRRKLIDPKYHEYDQLSFTKPGVIDLEPANYGKGRSWKQLRQRQATVPSAPPVRVEVVPYESCKFLSQAVKVGGLQ
ncbi:DUF2235 domain-containing protein [Paucibacter sp. DJ2R-2]|nr:DUF2235 domain-containing protein [Paucibacter sp. DJ2R-2]